MSSPARATTERKTERLELRVTPTAKEAIQQASALSGLTPGDLAYDAARRILSEHGGMRLSLADARAFYDAMENPPEPSPQLIDALKRHAELTGEP